MIKDGIKRLDRKYLNKFLFRQLNSRRIHLYCTGTFKSGTHSIRGIFKKTYRSEHEPDKDELLNIYLKIKKRTLSENTLQKIVLKREKRLYLEVNSSSLNYIILDQLIKLYPEAKFVHTIRNPYTWLDSMINHLINHKSFKVSQNEKKYFDDIFRRGKIPYRREEKILKKLELPTIEGMLGYWQQLNLTVWRNIPDDRLLVVKTKNISDKINTMIKFAGLNKIPGRIDSHAYKAREKHGILSRLDENFLEHNLNKYSLEFVNFKKYSNINK